MSNLSIVSVRNNTLLAVLAPAEAQGGHVTNLLYAASE